MNQSVFSTHQGPTMDHIASWKNCTACGLHQTTKSHVFFRGKVPCDVLFIGDQPSDDDQQVGLPFKDRLGSILDEIIEASVGAFDVATFRNLPQKAQIAACFGPKSQTFRLRVAITMAVCCHGEKPKREELAACSPRLAEFIRICQPKLLVYLGQSADMAGIHLLKHLSNPPRSITILHPVRMMKGEELDLEKKRASIAITTALENIFK